MPIFLNQVPQAFQEVIEGRVIIGISRFGKARRGCITNGWTILSFQLLRMDSVFVRLKVAVQPRVAAILILV